MTNEAVKKFSKEVIACLHDAESGCPSYRLSESLGDVIQCPPSAIRRGDFYVMGFNPGCSNKRDGQGGDSDKPKLLLETTRKLPTLADTDKHPLVGWTRGWKNLTNLAEALKVERWQQELFITNLFPDQSPGVSAWLRDHHDLPMDRYVDAIWPLHQLFLRTVQPRFVIVHGQGSRHSAFRYLWEHLKRRDNKAVAWDKTMSDATKNSDPTIKYFDLNDLDLGGGVKLVNVTFIGIKHLRLPRQSKMESLKALLASKGWPCTATLR